MRHGATPRSVHRAAPAGGLALLVRHGSHADRDAEIAVPAVAVGVAPAPPGSRPATVMPTPAPAYRAAAAPTGLHRQPGPRRRARREPQQALQMLMSGLGALIMFGICGLTGFFVVVDERRGHGAEAAERTAAPDRIGSRRVDARPLTLPEVFPKTRIRPAQGAAPYWIRDTHIDGDCDIAVTGRLGTVLSDHACSQVVRATMTAPYGGYRVTAGLFNLAEAADAAAVGEQARQLVETGSGTFTAMGAPGTDPLTQPPGQANWHEHGHYLVYCVISRPDGRLVTDADAAARRIIAEIMESYLAGEVLGRRTSGT